MYQTEGLNKNEIFSKPFSTLNKKNITLRRFFIALIMSAFAFEFPWINLASYLTQNKIS